MVLPLLVSALFTLSVQLIQGFHFHPRDYMSSLQRIGIPTFVSMVVLGLPLLWVYFRLRTRSFWAFPLGGGLCGFVTCAAMGGLRQRDILIYFGMIGFIVGVLFRLIVFGIRTGDGGLPEPLESPQRVHLLHPPSAGVFSPMVPTVSGRLAGFGGARRLVVRLLIAYAVIPFLVTVLFGAGFGLLAGFPFHFHELLNGLPVIGTATFGAMMVLGLPLLLMYFRLNETSFVAFGIGGGLIAVLTAVVMGLPSLWILPLVGFMGVIAGLMFRLIVLGWRTWPGLP